MKKLLIAAMLLIGSQNSFAKYECDTCSHSYATQATLASHQKVHPNANNTSRESTIDQLVTTASALFVLKTVASIITGK